MDNQRNLTVYRLYAPVYDALFRPLFQTARKRTIDRLRLQPGERLLLSGAGTGLDLPLIPSGVLVIAVDLSDPMLQKARERGNGRTALALMDAQTLGLADASFDAVALNLILTVVPDGAAAFAEAWRVLRPGGRAVIFDKFLPENGRLSPLRHTIGRVIAGLGTDPNRCLSDVLQATEPICIEQNEASILRGQYRIVLLHKPENDTKNEDKCDEATT
jgi:ubiquinone/menaquinone biosynthesis C-methylase UbiE